MINGADWNKDGFLDFSEFASFYHCLNEGLVKQVDPGNMSCDSHETSEHPKEEDEVGTDLRDAFKLFDKNGDGYICAEELQSVLSSMGIPQGKLLTDCRDMIRSVDVDGDGQVNFDEFKKMMASGIGGK
ncbi:hypothetical protein KP509_39G042000 [Ceratopteris richardii]|nr:hypothetical protein KP509_39G042000 [Ceratopteris richardii]